MKVKELVGSINTVRNGGARFYFKSVKSRRSLSNGVPTSTAYKYWGRYTIISWYIANTNTICVFIDPDERRLT